MHITIQANTTYFDPLPQDRVPEDMTFQQPYSDTELRRTAPKRGDERTDWVETNNEKGEDSDVSNRYASMPPSVMYFKLHNLYMYPTADALQEVQRLLGVADLHTRRQAYEYVNTLLGDVRYRLTSTATKHDDTAQLAAQAFILKRIFW